MMIIIAIIIIIMIIIIVILKNTCSLVSRSFMELVVSVFSLLTLKIFFSVETTNTFWKGKKACSPGDSLLPPAARNPANQKWEFNIEAKLLWIRMKLLGVTKRVYLRHSARMRLGSGPENTYLCQRMWNNAKKNKQWNFSVFAIGSQPEKRCFLRKVKCELPKFFKYHMPHPHPGWHHVK